MLPFRKRESNEYARKEILAPFCNIWDTEGILNVGIKECYMRRNVANEGRNERIIP